MKLTAATCIRADREELARRTLDPASHARWDLRFTDIEPEERSGVGSANGHVGPEADDSRPRPQRFRYATRIGFGLEVAGWGETVGKPRGDGTVLRFGSDDRRSLIREGVGSWTWRATPEGLRFATTYDYTVRFGGPGRAFDRLVFRPAMVWATRWSFDRLRLWLERGLAPELALRLWVLALAARAAIGAVWVWEGLVPKVLDVAPRELDLVHSSDLWLGSPAATLAVLGVLQALFGLVVLSGRAERATAALATGAMLALSTLVVVLDPAALADPLGGIAKNLGLVACALVVWVLAPHVPRARRAR